MDGNNFRFLSVHFLVNRYHFVTERGIFAVFPCRISTLNFVFSTEELGQILDFVGKRISGYFYGTSDAGSGEEFIVGQLNDTDVCGCFHQTFNVAAHFLDAKRNLYEIE